MKVQGKPYRSVWAERPETVNGRSRLLVRMINQPLLPHRFEIVDMGDHRETAEAIRNMTIRGAPAIGAAAAYGLAQAAVEAPANESRDDYIRAAHDLLRSTRPTAYDLFYALDSVMKAMERADSAGQAEAALAEAERLADESAERCRRIGESGLELIEPDMTVMTHCNAGWLACVDWGTALAPIYLAHREGRKPKVIASETRPRLQGANLTAWELGQEGVACEIAIEGAAGHLIRSGEIGMIVTGADRVAANGDIANKIGTYEKALLAREHDVPFYAAAPASTFDPDCPGGEHIPIEERDADEVLQVVGLNDDGDLCRIRLAPDGARARNPAFDVTPARLIAGLITEFGIIEPNRDAIARVMGERKPLAVG